MKKLLIFFATIIFFTGNMLYADKPSSGDISKSETSGFGISAGMGYHYAGFGGQLSYYYKPSDLVSIVPYIGGGHFPDDKAGRSGFAAGSLFEIGKRHRFVVDVGYGLAGIEYTENTYTGKVYNVRTLYGVTGAAGWELMTNMGIFVRLTAGVTYLVKEPSKTDTNRLFPTLNFGLGYKFF